MARRIEEYALVGDCRTAALVSKAGSIDWLCFPRFDGGACFAALLGDERHGFYRIAPEAEVRAVRRAYRGESMVLETELETEDGVVALVDFMPSREDGVELVRLVEGRRGSVAVRLDLVLRLDYGQVVPWVKRTKDGLLATAGPDALQFRCPVELHNADERTTARFTVREGERLAFSLTWHNSHEPPPPTLDPEKALADTERFWTSWARRCTYEGPHRDAVVRSLLTLKALTYAPTGGIVAAVTTSVPESPGGSRNWDYRYCWLRDATYTLLALVRCGYVEEARRFREWLLRACGGKPSQLHVLYGVAGERRVPELEIPWLPGFLGSKPVRVGNAAREQLQLDVFGEVMDVLHQCLSHGLDGVEGWALEKALLTFLESHWQEPDEGVWEVRTARRPFTHSRIMAWVAFDRAVKAVEGFGMDGPVERWRALRDTIHAEVCAKGYDPARGAFVQSYGSDAVDASLLVIPLVGFLPVDDPRYAGTVRAITRELMTGGFVQRYRSSKEADGLEASESAFLLCSFLLADTFVLQGRRDEAEELFRRVLAVRNDVGLLSESYDPKRRLLTGNFPQAFSHIGLVNTAYHLAQREGCEERFRR